MRPSAHSESASDHTRPSGVKSAAARLPVVIVGGPTASGKSQLALSLAERLGGTIINGDSMQVYRELQVLTARPGAADCARVPHRLYGTVPCAERHTVARWRTAALAEIEAVRQAGGYALVVGGTGMYLDALVDGLSPVPEIPAAVRAAAVAERARLGPVAFHAALVARDPAAARLAPADTSRTLRAWEVLTATGRPLSAWQAQQADGAPWPVLRALLLPDRDALAERIARRAMAMLADGAVEEVRALLALGLDPALPAMKALGVGAIRQLLSGEIGIDDCAQDLAAETRRYAKRQATWFRNRWSAAAQQPHISHERRMLFSAQLSESFMTEIRTIIDAFG